MNSKRLKILCITGITMFSILLVVFVCWIYLDNDDNIDDGIDKKYYMSRSGDNNEAGSLYNNTSEPAKAYETVKPEDSETITPDTKYILQTFYVDTMNGEQLNEEELTLPVDYIALNENELRNYLDEYIADMPLEEYLNGLISFEIISFDEEEVVLRKTYGNDWNRNEFYVSDSNGEVVVYYGDKETVYEYTGITTEELSDDDKIRLKLGCYVANAEELYALLESFSS